MARGINKLTSLQVTKLRKPGYYGDGGGLWLRVSPSVSKSWVFRFEVNGRRREMGLGAVQTVSLAMAREFALQCRRQLAAGQDPIEARDAERTVQSAALARSRTFDQCAEAYIKAHRASWKNAKHIAQWESTLKNYAGPVIGSAAVN